MYAVSPAYDMEKNRRDKDHAVDAIEYSAMALYDNAHVLDADIALDVADHQVTQLATRCQGSKCGNENHNSHGTTNEMQMAPIEPSMVLLGLMFSLSL